MTTIARLLSIAFSEANERPDDALPVLMFTAIGLLLVICLMLSNGAPPIAFETF